MSRSFGVLLELFDKRTADSLIRKPSAIPPRLLHCEHALHQLIDSDLGAYAVRPWHGPCIDRHHAEM